MKKKFVIVIHDIKRPLDPETYATFKLACELMGWNWDYLKNMSFPFYHKGYYINKKQIKY